MMTSTWKKCLPSAVVLLCAFGAWAGDSECDAVDGNLVSNCGWEANCWGDWHPSASIIDVGRDGLSHSGDYYGILHPHSGSEFISLEDLRTDVDQAYTLSFWVRSDSPIESLQVFWQSRDVEAPEPALDLSNVDAREWTQIVVPNLVAWDSMRLYWYFANSVSDVDIDDVILTPQ